MSGGHITPIVVLPWPPTDSAPPRPRLCGLVHPHAAEFAAAGASLLPCHYELGHAGRHCFDSDDSDDVSTLALQFGRASLDLTEHLQVCDACHSLTGPLCMLGAMQVDVVLDLGQRIRDHRRGWA